MNIQTYKNQGNLKQLFDQFKFHLIYKNKRKQTQQDRCSDELKAMLSEIKRECDLKREVKKNMLESIQAVSRAQSAKNYQTLHSRIWKPKTITLDSLESLKEDIIITEKQRQGLLDEIAKLENSLSQYKKNVASIKKAAEVESIKQQKYKHVQYLTKSIQRHTDSGKIINIKSFKKLVKYQEQALSNLKKFKTTLRKDNDQMENRYIQIQEHQKEKLYSPKLNYYTSIKNQPLEVIEMKLDKYFFNKLQQLLQLFINKEPSFQEIKAEQTTKIRLKKIQKGYLKQDRLKLHEMIDKLEDEFDVKMESLPNLILYIYKNLNKDNADMENQCVKRHHIKEILLEDLQTLKAKQLEYNQQYSHSNFEKSYEQEETKRRTIHNNSKMFIKFIYLIYNLLGKFKYLFTMTLTLSVEKKNFQDLLWQITNIYKSDSIFCQNETDEINSISFDSNITNFREMEDLLHKYETKCTAFSKQEFLSLIFCDLRYVLIFRRCWLEEEIKEGMEQDMILQKISWIQKKCQEIYESKAHSFTLLLISSLKALAMNKYQKKMIAVSNERESLFLSFPKQIKIVNLEENDEPMSNSQRQTDKQEQKFNSQESEIDPPPVQFNDDPRKMVQLLQNVKNSQKKTFIPFKFEPSQVYLYDSKVILPKYIF